MEVVSRFVFLGLLFAIASVGISQEAARPLVNAHAHNDYLHERPLLDALDQGFCSVEADVFLVKGDLWVAHSFLELDSSRTLKRLYLDPLRERLKQHAGKAYPKGPELTLLIDIKSDAQSTYAALEKLLEQYDDVFSHVKAGETQQRGVTAVISGNRSYETITASSPRFAGIDGRLSDLESPLSTDVLPLISDNWRSHFQWRGQGEIPEAERLKLERLVRDVHDQGRRIRFWATPDTPAAWRVLHDAGVDLINTDNLAGLSEFLNQLPDR